MNYPLHDMEGKLDFLIFPKSGSSCEQFVHDITYATYSKEYFNMVNIKKIQEKIITFSAM
jgi:hypothetical protein